MDHAEASETKTSPRAAIFLAYGARTAGSLLVSSGLKRTFSSSTTSPSFIAATLAWASSP